MKTAYKIIASISTAILLWWSLKEIVEALPNIGKRWWAIIILSLMVAALLFLIGIIKQFHERVIEELKADHETHAENIERLSELHGRGSQLMLNSSMDKVPAQTLRIWAEQIEKALYRCYYLEGLSKFEGGRGYTLEVPQIEAEQSNWLYATTNRLEDLIKEELPPPRKIDTSYLPDEAFMAS